MQNKWNYTLNIKQHIGSGRSNEDIVKAAEGVVSELKKLPVSLFLLSNFAVEDEIDALLYEFEEIIRCVHEESDNEYLLEAFNDNLYSLYDWADDNRVWLGLK